MRSSCASDCCLVQLEWKKTNLCSSVFILSSFNSAAFVILLFWWTASSSLVFRDRICSSLCSRERDNSLACAVTSSNLQKQKQKNRSISKYLAETNCSEETTKIDWIRSNFIFDMDPPFSNSFTRNWFDDKKKANNNTATLSCWRSLVTTIPRNGRRVMDRKRLGNCSNYLGSCRFNLNHLRLHCRRISLRFR